MFGNIVVFEDHEESNFYPLTELRPVFELKTGIFSMMERIYMNFPDSRYHLFARDYLRPSMLLKYPQFFINDQNVGVQALLLNGRLVMTKSFAELLNSQRKRNFLVVDGHNILAAHLEKKLLQQFINIGTLERFKPDILLEYVRKNNEIRVISYKEDILLKNPWDLINKNGDCLKKDFKLLNKGGLILSDINTQVILTKEDNIFIDKHSKIDPFVHLDASKGPIYIAEHVQIKSNVVIEGPAFIDEKSIIYPGYIRENTTIGSGCRVGGEVENSIFHANSNKYHAGFVGHSYVGEWVNLGALTTTSDLKNNYGPIKITLDGQHRIDTKTQFLGSLIGDHVKTGIGTMLKTGTVLGMGSNIFDAVSVPKWVAPFSWGDGLKFVKYKKDKFIETAETVFSRRGKEFLLPEKNLLEYVYEERVT